MPAEDLKVLPLNPTRLVLVVDDEARPRSVITHMVRSLGYQARSCHGGRAALEFLKDYPREVRLLLSDLGMPQMDGGELAERAKDLDPRLIAALMADPQDPDLGELIRGYAGFPFVPKPVSFADLAEKLERLLGVPAAPPHRPVFDGSRTPASASKLRSAPGVNVRRLAPRFR